MDTLTLTAVVSINFTGKDVRKISFLFQEMRALYLFISAVNITYNVNLNTSFEL